MKNCKKRIGRSGSWRSTYYDFCGGVYTFYNAPTKQNSGLVFRPRLKLYSFENDARVTFCPIEMVATSYHWWVFVRRINGKIVFNAGKYSKTTSTHQYTVAKFLSAHNIHVDLVIFTKLSLAGNMTAVGNDALEQAIRTGDIKRAQKIARIFKLRLSQKLIDEITLEREIELCNAYLERAFEYQENKRRRILTRLGADPDWQPDQIPQSAPDTAPTSEVFPWAA